MTVEFDQSLSIDVANRPHRFQSCLSRVSFVCDNEQRPCGRVDKEAGNALLTFESRHVPEISPSHNVSSN